MRLLTASASPFANKVRMAARLAGFDLPATDIDAAAQPAELLEANPLGKIPCLILDDGTALFDNRPILAYLDRTHNLGLYPRDSESYFRALRFEALCDGINDCAVAWQYERRMRPEEKHHQPWLDRQWGKVTRALVEAAKELPPLGADAEIRAMSLAAVLGYLQLRFAGLWEEEHPALAAWMADFEARHADVAALKPSA